MSDDAAFFAGLPRKRVSAGALVTDEDGRVLMVQPTYKPAWEIPGGAVEDGETAPAACRRECQEELGIQVTVGRLLVVDHRLHAERGDALLLVYDGGTLPAATTFRVPPDELHRARFVPPGEVAALTVDALTRRIEAALAARASGTVVELDDGTPAP